MKRLSIVMQIVCLSFVLSACVSTEVFRTEFVEHNCVSGKNCEHAIIERYLEYDLAFLEFTERGNLFNRERADKVLDYIQTQAKKPNGAAVFVFVHGWKHNARFNDSNVKQFRELLSLTAENEVVGKRRMIGLYIGWRGNSNLVPGFRELTYWRRKSVAEEIGSGGVTEILSKLHHVLVRGDMGTSAAYKNYYVILGHSFGGAIVLSAMHDILLNNLVEANYAKDGKYSSDCAPVRRFADGVILLNPAIEANKAMLLKEAADKCHFKEKQNKLMHVISSEGDSATRVYFPIGQFLNVSTTTRPKKLLRDMNGKQVKINELDLDLQTVGNYPQFRSSYLFFNKKQKKWKLNMCRDDFSACRIMKKASQKNHMGSRENSPFSFVKTDANFIQNHNDVFGCYIRSYITTTILETQSLDTQYQQSNTLGAAEQFEGCARDAFDLNQCFISQLDNSNCLEPESFW